MLEQPVAQVDRQVDAVNAVDVEQLPIVFHVHGHELVADLGGVLSRVREAELGILHLFLDFGVLGDIDLLRLNALGPADVVEALTEENDECQHHAVEGRIRLFADVVQVDGECLVDHHLIAGRLVQSDVLVEVVTPATLLPRDTVVRKATGLVRLGLFVLVSVFFGLRDLSLQLTIVLLLILTLVGARKLDQLHEKRIALHRLVTVAALEDLLVVLLEGVDWVGGTTPSFDRVEVVVSFGVGALVSLHRE